MNMHPKVRPFWQRALIIPVLGLLAHLQGTPFATENSSSRFACHRQEIGTTRCFGPSSRVASLRPTSTNHALLTRLANMLPKAEVVPEFRMTEEEFTQFHRDGFIGPVRCLLREEMAQLRQEMLAVENENSETYGFVTPRDRHLESPRLWEHMNHPQSLNGLPNFWVPICSAGGLNFSTKALVRQQFNFIKPARSWSKTTSTRQSIRHAWTKCFS